MPDPEFESVLRGIITKQRNSALLWAILFPILTWGGVLIIYLLGWIHFLLTAAAIAAPFVSGYNFYIFFRDMTIENNPVYNLLINRPQNLLRVNVLNSVAAGSTAANPKYHSHKVTFFMKDGKKEEVTIKNIEDVVKIQNYCKKFTEGGKPVESEVQVKGESSGLKEEIG